MYRLHLRAAPTPPKCPHTIQVRMWCHKEQHVTRCRAEESRSGGCRRRRTGGAPFQPLSLAPFSSPSTLLQDRLRDARAEHGGGERARRCSGKLWALKIRWRRQQHHCQAAPQLDQQSTAPLRISDQPERFDRCVYQRSCWVAARKPAGKPRTLSMPPDALNDSPRPTAC